MLARVRQRFEVENLWYGALEMTQDGLTPVLKLDGLDRVRQWLEALNRFDATGNYRVFGALLTKDGVEPNTAKHLENAAFYERTLNLSAAAAEIRQFRAVLESELPGASGLFKERLANRLRWVDLGTLSEQQAELAYQSLKRRDYLRAAMFGWESLVSMACEQKCLDPQKRENRERQNVLREVDPSKRKTCENLNQIRNALAHGSSSHTESARKMLADEHSLRTALQDAFHHLIGEPKNSMEFDSSLSAGSESSPPDLRKSLV